MASWSTRRKTFYLSIAALFLLVVVGGPAFLVFYKAPTCFDGKQNGSEAGTDCGGSCKKLCPSAYLPAIVGWSRAHKVKDGVYNLLAYVENPNLEAAAPGVPYVFKVYDKNGVLIGDSKGRVTIAPHDVVPVFVPAFLSGESVPVRVTFEFTAAPVWEKRTEGLSPVSVSSQTLVRETPSPRIDATISNPGVKPVPEVEVIAIAFDADDNALGFSETFIDFVPARGSERVSFTWPEPFAGKVYRIEVVPIIRD